MHHIFCIESQPFVAFILKLSKICNDRKKFFVTLTNQGQSTFEYYHSNRQILDPLTKQIHFYDILAPDPVLYYTRDSHCIHEFETDELFLEKLRITHVKEPYDGVTVSKDLLDKTDLLLNMMNKITKNQLFQHKITENKGPNDFKQLPYWFSVNGINTISAWVVVHFEMRLQY